MPEKTVSEKNVEKEVVSREVTRNPDFFVQPLVDIFETPQGLAVVADLPGVPKDGLNVKVEDGVLTIEGRISHEFIRDPMVQEFEPESFFRQFELSEKVDQEKISAELKNGVLTVLLPRIEEKKPREIKVKIE